MPKDMRGQSGYYFRVIGQNVLIETAFSLEFQGLGAVQSFLKQLEGGQNVLIKTPASLANKGKNKV